MPEVWNTVTAQDLQEELNYIAEYAGITNEFRVEACADKLYGIVSVTNQDETFWVQLGWAKGVIGSLPDHTNLTQMCTALRASHPDVLDVLVFV